MNDMQAFYALKHAILERYRAEFPFYTGDIQGFGNKEIAQLIDLVEQGCHERVSEKWVYTHLKPLENSKLPRRDMLDIFSRWVGYSSWEEFIFRNKKETQDTEIQIINTKTTTNSRALMFAAIALLGSFMAIGASLLIVFKKEQAEVCIKDRYTQKPIDNEKVTLLLIDNGKPGKLSGKNGCYTFKFKGDTARIAVQSAYYKPDTLTVTSDSSHFEFDLQPDDYAMMLRAYMNGNVGDWQKRRSQLAEIISNDAVIQEIMFNDIGVEFLNKDEFIAKVTTPVKAMQTLEVVEVDYKDKKIISLKYIIKK
jgi:hypothetical protein